MNLCSSVSRTYALVSSQPILLLPSVASVHTRILHLIGLSVLSSSISLVHALVFRVSVDISFCFLWHHLTFWPSISLACYSLIFHLINLHSCLPLSPDAILCDWLGSKHQLIKLSSTSESILLLSSIASTHTDLLSHQLICTLIFHLISLHSCLPHLSPYFFCLPSHPPTLTYHLISLYVPFSSISLAWNLVFPLPLHTSFVFHRISPHWPSISLACIYSSFPSISLHSGLPSSTPYFFCLPSHQLTPTFRLISLLFCTLIFCVISLHSCLPSLSREIFCLLSHQPRLWSSISLASLHTSFILYRTSPHSDLPSHELFILLFSVPLVHILYLPSLSR